MSEDNIPTARAGVLIKFTDGESMRFNFASHAAAVEFYTRAKTRDDAFSVAFIDPDLQSVLKSGYPDSSLHGDAKGENS